LLAVIADQTDFRRVDLAVETLLLFECDGCGLLTDDKKRPCDPGRRSRDSP
jgi:hypothetical protein